MVRPALRAFLVLVVILFPHGPAEWLVGAQAVRIDGITPAAGRPGDRVTLIGAGFGAFNVRVTVDGIAALVVEASGNRLTFVVPAGVEPGSAVIRMTNPGGLTASIGFSIAQGALLAGAPTTPIGEALIDLPPVPVDYDEIENGVIMTRVIARLATSATVGQVNAAMTHAGGGIVAMHPATSTVTVGIPRQSSLEAIRELAISLALQPGISAAWPAREVRPRFARFPVTPDALARQRFLLPSRFPAAWNALTLVLEVDASGAVTCRHPKVPLLVADFFGDEPDGFAALFPTLRRASSPPLGLPPEDGIHGYNVTLTAAGALGANPFPECLDVRLVQSAGFASSQDIMSIAANMPAGRFIVNYSLGFDDSCAGPVCQPPDDALQGAPALAYDSLTWKELTRSRWADFLLVAAAGNERAEPSAAIWPGAGDATVNSPMAIASTSDPFLTFASSDALWTPGPSAAAQGFTTLAASPATQEQIAVDVQAKHLGDADDVASNVVLVGSSTNTTGTNVTTTYTPPEALSESVFSDRNAQVRAVGEDLFDPADLDGTSFAAPQVAGLASYLWLVSPELRNNQPPSATRDAIVANARTGTVDAYAAVLSLDEPVMPTPATAPVRLAILDLDRDGGFTDTDIDLFLRELYFVDPETGTITGAPPANATVTLTLFDLNGDGISTSSSRRERFDLDRVGSTRFGATSYSTVTQNILGQNVRFDEMALTDVEILCYYAYSPMFGGHPGTRDSLLGGRCGLAIQPTQVTLNAGQQQQFSATGPVTWTGDGGQMSPTGVYTAGAVAGTFTVRATSTLNSALTAEASVTIVGSTTPPPIGGPYDGAEIRGIVGEEATHDTGRWVLMGGSASGQLFRAGGVGSCPENVAVVFFQCTPPFTIVNGAFSATAGGRTVSGTVGGGHLQFVLEEACPNNDGEIVVCRLEFDGQLVTIEVSPSLLDFGTIAAGTTSSAQTISIANRGLFPLQVFLAAPGFTIAGSTCFMSFVPEGGSCEVRIAFSPGVAGSYDQQVQFTAGGAAIVGTVRVKGVAQ